jgi:hypothetical protein
MYKAEQLESDDYPGRPVHLIMILLDFASWRDNTTDVRHRCLMQLKSWIVGAGAGRRSRRSWPLAPSHSRTELAEVPRVSMREKSGSLRFARAPTKEDSSSSVYPSSSSF